MIYSSARIRKVPPVFVIPAIDLKSGTVVRARQGRRAAYRPLAARLGGGSAAREVIGALLRLHHFPAVYVADLDAIEGQGDNAAVLAGIAAAFPALELWVDSGIGDLAALESRRGPGRAVIGSESLRSLPQWRRMRARAKDKLVLSLDYRGHRFLGPPLLAHTAALWPKRVIVMTLARVGARTGPDLTKLRAAMRRAGRRDIFAAGGLRNARDIARLAGIGAAGVLAAGALYDGRLSPRALALARK